MLSMLAEVKRLVHRNKDLTVLSTKVEIYKEKGIFSGDLLCSRWPLCHGQADITRSILHSLQSTE